MVEDVDNGGATCVYLGLCKESLYLLPNFTVNLKLLLKNSLKNE